MDLATLGIRVDATGAIQQTKMLSASLGGLSDSGSKLQGVMTGLAGIMGAGFVAHQFISNTEEAQHATAQLEAAIKSTGGAAHKTLGDLQDYSAMLQSTTAFSDDAVQGAQAMLLTFNKIEGANFDAATSAITDLAARMGTDLSGAAVQVGKALQDPATGLTALRRSGVSFTEAQIKVIKDLNDTGHAAEAQRLILAELNKEFGGAAAAARGTLGGALKGLKNDFGDLFELTKDETSGLVSLINGLSGAMKGMHDFGVEVKTVIQLLGAAGLTGAIIKLGSGTTLGALGSLAMSVTSVKDATLLWQTATLGAGTAMKGLLVTMGPLVLLATAGALAVYTLNKAIEEHEDAVEEDMKNSKEYVDYLKALGRSKSDKGGAGQLVKPPTAAEPPSDAQKKAAQDFKNTTAEIQSQIDKQKALNAVYGQSELTLQLVGIQQDLLAKNRAIDASLTDAQRAAIVKLNTEMAKALADAAKQDAAKKDKERADKLAAANLRVEIELTMELGKRREENAAKERERIQASIAAHEAKMKRQGDEMVAASKEAEAQQKYADDMRAIIRDGVVGMVTDFVKNWRKGFDDVLALAVKMMRRMEEEAKRLGKAGADGKGYKALQVAGYAGAAIQGGMAGYDIGRASESGNKGSSALFGALGGAASGAAVGTAILPGVGTAIGAAVGAIAGFVGGIVGAGHAADLSEKEMLKLRDSLVTSVNSIRATLANDTLGQSLATLKDQFDKLRAAAEDAFAYGKNEAERAKALAEINELEAARIAQVKAEAALVQKRAQEDLAVRKLLAEGHLAEANAMQFAAAQIREYEDAVKRGADATTLAALAETQKAEATAHALAVARTQARQQEDIRLRIMRAQNDPAYEEAVRQAEHRREIEDLIAQGASAATIALVQFAQGLEDSAAAAASAAAVQAAIAEEMRATEDLDVEILRMRGDTAAADEMEFKHEQERRYDEAVAKYGADSEYVKKLTSFQQGQRDSRAADQLIAATSGGDDGGGMSRNAATDATSAVQATVTERTAYALVDIGRQQLSAQLQMVDLLTAIASGGGGSSSFHDVDTYLGSGVLSSGLYAGSVTRT